MFLRILKQANKMKIFVCNISSTFILFTDKRPKRLLVFINPRSGSRKAEKIYAKRVLPAFELCEIQTNVIGMYLMRKILFILIREIDSKLTKRIGYLEYTLFSLHFQLLTGQTK